MVVPSSVDSFSSRPFIGTGWSYPFEISQSTGGIAQNLNDNIDQSLKKVRDSIYQILFTRIGERPGRRGFGSDALNAVFAPNDEAVFNGLLTHLRLQIAQYEKRVIIPDGGMRVEVLKPSTGEAVMAIEVQLAGTNIAGNLVFPFYLQGQSSTQSTGSTPVVGTSEVTV